MRRTWETKLAMQGDYITQKTKCTANHIIAVPYLGRKPQLMVALQWGCPAMSWLVPCNKAWYGLANTGRYLSSKFGFDILCVGEAGVCRVHCAGYHPVFKFLGSGPDRMRELNPPPSQLSCWSACWKIEEMA